MILGGSQTLDLFDMLVLGLFGALLAHGKKLHNVVADKA
jgi:hypothetical protein